jgi:hypothetical protein
MTPAFEPLKNDLLLRAARGKARTLSIAGHHFQLADGGYLV